MKTRESHLAARQTSSSRWPGFVLAFLALIVIAAALGGLKFAQIKQLIDFGKQMEAQGPPPETVNAAPAEARSWDQRLQTVGTVVSDEGVMLTAEVAGTVTRVRFASGQEVRRGRVLVELDAAVEKAQLQAVLARKNLAEQTLRRLEQVVARGGVSAQEADAERARVAELAADADALRAQIAKKTIRAPFAGKLGVRQVSVGQYLSPGTAIARLESAEALFVEFELPEKHFDDVTTGMLVELSRADLPALEGRIAAIEPSLSASTRMFRLRASLPVEGRESEVRSGMFFDVSVKLGAAEQAVVVPVTAVKFATFGDSVFAVQRADKEGQSSAEQRFVKLGEQRGDYVRVLKGLEPGVEVVTGGVFKLQNGAPIVVDNSVQPKTLRNPTLGKNLENR